ncbi:MAG: hypothetical protein Q4C87_01260 [Actinomycetaceae bacterium]|nr:hypothetical protein [Actinomycetaceae bacterium]
MKHLRHSLLAISCAIALLAAGCAGPSSSGLSVADGNDETDNSASASSSPEPSQSSKDTTAEPEKKATDTPPSVEEKKPEEKPEDKPSATPSAQIPDGWKKVTGKKSGVSFAVPNDWVGFGQDTDEETSRKNVESISPSPEAAEEALKLRPDSDLLYASPEMGGITKSVILSSEGFPEILWNTEEKARKAYERNPAFKLEKIEEVDSPVGKILVATGESNGFRTRDFYAPNGKGQVYEIALLGFDDAEVDERSKKIIASLSHK